MMRNPQFLAFSPVSIGGIEHHIYVRRSGLDPISSPTKFVIGEQISNASIPVVVPIIISIVMVPMMVPMPGASDIRRRDDSSGIGRRHSNRA
jgi:hypothetical protein